MTLIVASFSSLTAPLAQLNHQREETVLCCPVWQGAVFYVILGWVLQSQQSFLVCKWHCVHRLPGPAGQQRQKKGHKWRLISKGGESSGEMEMVRGLSWVMSLGIWRSCVRRKTGPEQCVGNVQRALQSFGLLCVGTWPSQPLPCHRGLS